MTRDGVDMPENTAASVVRRHPWRVTVLVATVLVLAGALVLVPVLIGRSGPPAPPGAPVRPGAPGTAQPTPGAPAPTGAAPAPTAPRTGTSFRFQPLWPFTDPADAELWQVAHRTGGHQPWHLDAGQTALGFASGFLGFTGIDRVTSTESVDEEAWVGVGFALPDGRVATAAVVHLARIGSGDDAPWEVVGTRDDTLTLDTPAYGSTVTSPIRAGGTVTGVDENLRLQVHRNGTPSALGDLCCLPAGGEAEGWSAEVPFVGGRGGEVLTLVVRTGGHVAEVERFAVTGLRTP